MNTTIEFRKQFLENQPDIVNSEDRETILMKAYALYYHDNKAFNKPESIGKLPTDEEIINEAEGRYPVKRHSNPDDSPYVGPQKTFIHGVRWALAFVQGKYR